MLEKQIVNKEETEVIRIKQPNMQHHHQQEQHKISFKRPDMQQEQHKISVKQPDMQQEQHKVSVKQPDMQQHHRQEQHKIGYDNHFLNPMIWI